MTIRKAIKEDVSKIVELLAHDELGRKRENFQIPLPPEYMEAFEVIDADENQELMVVEDEKSEIIGTMQLTFVQYMSYCGGLRAQIESVHLKESHRGMGIGKKMFEWTIKRAKSTFTTVNFR
ncbi:GNAT family N-acetyltransferase [Flavivirga eckloniae]|uniref:GNAT family N-acetyltransferase n=1 Tax=Flavivirga eckloniae TaxID=1803846 RepID=UPI001F3A8786|nr:GNAT family N-acetyltransferase [Flavivirga eckloniae]